MNQSANRLIGKMIRGYCLEELLTCEDAAATYRARTQELWQVPELLITVLLLPERFSKERRARFQERFLRESQRIATLRHHYLLPLYGCGEQDGLLYLIGPYMTGETLAEQLQRGKRWSPTEALEILRSLAAVLDHIHEQGLAYQFLEPSNILLPNSTALQLAGLGKKWLLRNRGLEEESPSPVAYSYLKSITGAYLGAPQYMAPEVLKGAEADRRSDVYSLGVLICELLSGQPIFAEQNYVEIADKHVREPLPPLRELAPDLPASLELVLNRALSRNPDRRFQRPAALLNAYSQMLDLRVQTPAPVALVQQVKEMFALPPAAQSASYYLPAPNPQLPAPAPARPQRVTDRPARIAARAFATPSVVPSPAPRSDNPSRLSPAAPEAEETMLVSKDQLHARLQVSQAKVVSDVQKEGMVEKKKKHPFGDTAPRPAVQVEEDVPTSPIVYAGGNAISAVDAILQIDTPVSSELEQSLQDDNPFEQEPEESPFEEKTAKAAPTTEVTEAPRRASLDLLYQGDQTVASPEKTVIASGTNGRQQGSHPDIHTEQPPRRASLDMVYQGGNGSIDDVVTEDFALPVSSADITRIQQAGRAPANTEAEIPLVQETRTHVMAMASQLQQMKERLQEQSKSTGIRRLD